MRKVIKASKASEFAKHYNRGYASPSSYQAIDNILLKYGDQDEDIRDVFERASELEQDKMLALAKPQFKLGQRGYSAQLYRSALRGDLGSDDYCDGVSDMIHALITEGLLDKNEFRAFEWED